jgi:hypothetical protein
MGTMAAAKSTTRSLNKTIEYIELISDEEEGEIMMSSPAIKVKSDNLSDIRFSFNFNFIL